MLGDAAVGLGTWTVSSRAVFTRAGYATQYSAYGYKSVATKGLLPADRAVGFRQPLEGCSHPQRRSPARQPHPLAPGPQHPLQLVRALADRHGVGATSTPKLIRPPYGAGAYSQRITNDAAALGYRVCHRTTDTSDYAGVSATTIINKVLYGDAVTAPARAGGSVLMHMSGANTPAALPGSSAGSAPRPAARAPALIADLRRAGQSTCRPPTRDDSPSTRLRLAPC